VWSWDSEHGDDSFLGDAYLGDQGLDGGFALGGGAGVEDVVQVGAEPLDGVGRGCGGLVADGVGDLVVAGLELVDLGAQGGDAGAGGGVVHGAVLECGEVPVDRGLLGLDLGEDGAGFGVPAGVAVAVAGPGAGDGVGDEAGGLGVEVGEGAEDGGVGVVGGQPGGVAAVGAVADAGEAGVVAVGAAAAGRGGADVLVAAAGAGDLPGEVVVAVAGGALGLRVGALGRDRRGALPGLAVDERVVGVLDVGVAVGDVPGVGGVGQDPGDGVPGPGLAGAVADAPAVQLGGDGPGAEPLAGVEPEDLLQVRCFLGVRDELVRVAVDPVAVRAGAAGAPGVTGEAAAARPGPREDAARPGGAGA
jgi:hypothetical protein